MSPVSCAAWLTRRWMRPGAARLGSWGPRWGPGDWPPFSSSPLLRARQTAQPVGEQAGLEVAVDQCLLDRDYGPWTGISRESVTDRWGSVDRAPGVEPRPAVRDRAIQGLTGIARRHPGGTVVVVSHDAVNREVLAAFDVGLGNPGAIPQDNGCYNTLERRCGRWAVLGVNEVPEL